MSKPGETSLLSHPSRRFKRRNFPGEDRFLEEEESKRKQSPGRKLSSLVEWLIRFERETRFPRRTMASLSGNLGRFEFIFPAFLRPCNQEFHSIKKLHFPTLFFETVFAFVVGKQRFILARNFLPLGYFFETLTRWRKQPS